MRPHERTFPGPKADRLELLRATGAYLSPIFGLHAGAGPSLRGAGEIDCILPDRRLRLRPAAGALRRIEHLPPPLRALDVALFEHAILRPILGLETHGLAFTDDDAEAIAAVPSAASAAFLLNPPSIDAVRAVCLTGEVMPEKSTYFYPKLADGLVFDTRWG